MQDTAGEIDNKLGGDESNDNREWSDLILNCVLGEFPPKVKSKAQIKALHRTFSVGVVVLPQVLFLIDLITVANGSVGG